MKVQRVSAGALSLAGFLGGGGSTQRLAALPLAKKTSTPCSGGWVGAVTGWTHTENMPPQQPQTVHSVVVGYAN